MKVSNSWLTAQSGVEWPPEKTARRLTATGTAGLAEMANPDHFKNVVVGKITKLEKHPDADRLVVTEVDTGASTQTIICGAPNCAAGQKVAVALPGANLKGEMAVKEITMRGVKSAGMICAEDELGLSDDHSGIMVLDNDAELGTPIFDYLHLDDAILDFEITPNRPDCLNVNGLSRELALLAGKSFEPPKVSPKESDRKASEFIKVTIADKDACPRYAVRIIDNLKIGPSPQWMKKRLIDCGVRPINNLVDITNYIMLETGQPLHAFDYNRFGSGEVVVRRAAKDEKFATLDGREHTLDESVLLITNGKVGVAAAGVMGGLDSEVDDKTTTVLLESAYFDPSTVRKSARKLGLSTESSYRFERGVDPNAIVYAADRVAELMQELAGGEVLSGVVDNNAKKIEPVKIEMRPDRARRIIGADIPTSFMEDTLRGLGMEVQSGDKIMATVPTYRPDITREIDLIEEIARIYGLEEIPVSHNNGGPLFTPTHRRDTIKNDLRKIMTGFGFEEALGTGFAHPDRMAKIDPTLEPVQVLNPLSDEFGAMRTRMLYSLLLSGGNNIRHRNVDFNIFEIGRVYRKDSSGPIEPEYLGVIMTGRPEGVYWKTKPGQSDFFDLKGILAALAESLNFDMPSLNVAQTPGFDRTQSYNILLGDHCLGHIGRIDRRIARLFDIKQDCFAIEMELDGLINLQKGLKPFSPLPRYPASYRDIAVVVDQNVTAEELLAEIKSSGGRLMESVEIFDLFTGDPVPEGKKSLAFSVSYRSLEKTLEDREVDEAHGQIVNHIEKKFKARLRE